MNDFVNHPRHYTSHPSGVECIEITEHMNFNLGNAVKYIWRASLKGKEIEDLRKARWYVDREIWRLVGDKRDYDALRQTIEQAAKQEPVAWMVYTLDSTAAFVTLNPADFTGEHRALPLYTTLS